MDGVILTRNAEPGEFVQPGAVAFALADLTDITITVYVPEDRYGQISLGQQAQVTVDSYPGEAFTAEVIHIADQAEFTPRNVQTVEGRSSTVYAIKLSVDNSGGKLKIGMPADVTFK
jgi:HlyD family secretion protein